MRTSGPLRLTKLRSIPLAESLTDGGPPQQSSEACIRSFKYASAFRLLLQIIFCIASVVLGFRISQEIFLVVLQFRYVEESLNWLDRDPENIVNSYAAKLGLSDDTLPGFSASMVYEKTIFDTALPHPDARLPEATLLGSSNSSNRSQSSRIQVGRHQIFVREWPHPDPTEMMRAYQLIARVQLEQAQLHSVKDWKPVIAITPTYSRMFQALHLTGLMHTLSFIRGPVTWIVIEAGGTSMETADLLAQARVHNVVHLGYPKPMPLEFEARWVLESHLRLEGLRFVREKKLEGVIVFADDSNVHSLEFFNLIQKVKWVGVLPMGILGYGGFQDVNVPKSKRRRRGSLLFGVVHTGQVPPKIELQVQALARNSNGSIGGWHAHRPLPLDWDSGKGTALLDEKLQWAGFVMNARAVWASEDVRPRWLKDWEDWTRLKEGVYLDLRSILQDETQVEPLADSRHTDVVRHWWIRMEGRPDCKYPSRWALDSQPEIVLPASRTPWPEGVLNYTFTSPVSPSRLAKRSSSSKTTRSKRRRPDVTRRKQPETTQFTSISVSS